MVDAVGGITVNNTSVSQFRRPRRGSIRFPSVLKTNLEWGGSSEFVFTDALHQETMVVKNVNRKLFRNNRKVLSLNGVSHCHQGILKALAATICSFSQSIPTVLGYPRFPSQEYRNASIA